MRKSPVKLSAEEKARVVLAVLAGELGLAEAARRHRVSVNSVGNWRNRFLAGGRQALEDRPPGAAGSAGSDDVRRMRAEIEQLTLALAALAMETARFRQIYNTIRPHQALGDHTPHQAYLR